MTVYGARIICSVCGARPWPDSPSDRETFDLRLVDDNWFCELHRPPRRARVARSVPKPTAALSEFENLFEAEIARLAEEVDDCEDHDVAQALKTFRQEIARGLSRLGE
jgi:hypothetical protein